jgi:hypothetical protein
VSGRKRVDVFPDRTERGHLPKARQRQSSMNRAKRMLAPCAITQTTIQRPRNAPVVAAFLEIGATGGDVVGTVTIDKSFSITATT